LRVSFRNRGLSFAAGLWSVVIGHLSPEKEKIPWE
jgi:hypothetical protein